MTEAEWLASTDPEAMLKILRGKASDRKLRLLASACCRQAGHVFAHQALLNAIETAERYADGQARYGEMVQAAKAITFFSYSAGETEAVVAGGIWHLATMGIWWNFRPIRRTERTILALLNVERYIGSRLAPFLRDIFGNPFRPVSIDHSWLTSSIVSLARQMYESRDFSPMPILADALQDTGCDNVQILDHCRGEGVHVRGCFVIDLILKKK